MANRAMYRHGVVGVKNFVLTKANMELCEICGSMGALGHHLPISIQIQVPSHLQMRLVGI